MKFSDNISRNDLDIVFVKRSENEFEARDEYNSLLWDIEKSDISRNGKERIHLYATPVRDLKIGENIYDKKGVFIAYRSN